MYNLKRILFSIPITIAMVATLALAIYMLIYFYNKLPIACSDISTLENLMRINLSDAEIIDIQSSIGIFDQYTEIVIYAKSDIEYMNGEYFVRTNRSDKFDKGFEYIPAADIKILRENSFEIGDISQYGLSYSTIRNGMSDCDYTIYWYALGNENGKNTDLIFITLIPRRVIVNMSICR